jgi:hypothetical protein
MKKIHIDIETFNYKVLILGQPFILKKDNNVVFFGDVEAFEDQNPNILVVNYTTLIDFANKNSLILDIDENINFNSSKNEIQDQGIIRKELEQLVEEHNNSIKSQIRYAYVDDQLKEWFLVDEQRHKELEPISLENKLFNLFIVEGYYTDEVATPHIIEPVIGVVLTDYTKYLECQCDEQNFHITKVISA